MDPFLWIFGASFSWKLATPLIIALLPVILHVIDKILENFSPITTETVRLIIEGDPGVKLVGENKALFNSVRAYFDYERDCHLVFVLTIFNIVSLYFAQTACTGSFLESTPLTFVMMVLLLLFLGVFFIWLCNKKIDPASVNARHWWRRPDLIKWWRRIAFVQFGIVICTDIALHHVCGSHEANAGETTMKAVEKPLDSAGATLSAMLRTMEAIEMRLDSVGPILSVIQKTTQKMETGINSGGTTLTGITKTLEGIDAQLLDMRIAQPVDLSYLTGADCRRVQQPLKELAGYKGRIDGICDGATNAAAREWQIQNRQTIAPARTAEEIERRLRTLSAQSVNTGR